jgi:phage-related holin
MGQMMARKVILYAFAIASVLILSSSNVGIFFWAPTYLGLFFIVSEVLSVLEKLALMGLNVPLGLVAKINDVFDRLNKGDQSALKEIYRKDK